MEILNDGPHCQCERRGIVSKAMKTGAKVILGILVLLPSVPAAAKDRPLVLEPSSKWNVHYADDFCRLARTFGTGDEAITIFLDRFSPSSTFRLNLIGQPMKRWVSDGKAQIRFGRELPDQSLYFYVGSFENKGPTWTFAAAVGLRPWVPEEEYDEVTQRAQRARDEANVSEIAIGSPLRTPVILQTGPMKNAFAALHACTEQLVSTWGVNIESHRTAQRLPAPVGTPEKWITSFDYPPDMLRKRQPGLVEFRLMIDAEGKATACHIQQSTNPEGFNDIVCEALMRRAKFEPALDKDGRPMASYYRSRGRFHM